MNKILIILITLSMAACSQNNSQQEELKTPDATEEMAMSAKEIQVASSEAKLGDKASAKRLYEHFLASGDENAADYWETRLVEQGDSEAMASRAERLFSESQRFVDKNPKKLALLREAVALNTRAQLVDNGRPHVALINGKEVDVSDQFRKTSERFTKNLEDELKRIQSTQTQ